MADDPSVTPDDGNSRNITFKGDLSDTDLTALAGVDFTTVRRANDDATVAAAGDKLLSEEFLDGEPGEEKRNISIAYKGAVGSQTIRSATLALWGADQVMADDPSVSPDDGNSRNITFKGDLSDTAPPRFAGVDFTTVRRANDDATVAAAGD